jgi:preprotein translocase subunit SecA
MFGKIARVLSGDPVRRQLEQYAEKMARINELEPAMKSLSEAQLKAKGEEFRQRVADGEPLDDLLVEAYAVVREVAVRMIGMRHFDVQLIGAMILHEGKIAEMKTGEGKTLVATMPLYLNALEGKGVHLVTVNDYLARRDARWMGPIYHFLGMSVGVLQQAARTESGRKAFHFDPERTSVQEDLHQLRLVDRKQAYAADVTYGTNNEFGFDYLRDNMAHGMERRAQRGFHYAILDEVDNILIDEARTPLIISGPSHEDPELYLRMAQVVRQLSAEDYEVSERDRTVALTEIGEDHVERILGVPLRDPDRPEDITPDQARLLGHLEQALRAEHLFKRNKHYVVQGGRVIIVDEFTGRMMPDRRWSDGLHQAVEAKEGARVRQENVTYATITLQNYFRKYDKLSGMTGTAVTEAEEFNKIYNVDVIPLPTNIEFMAMQPDSDLVPVEYRENGNKFTYFARKEDEEQAPVFWVRKDYADVVFRTEEAKFRAICAEILSKHVRGQPLLVGTTSVELSEALSSRLKADMLLRLASVLILRDAYFEKHAIPDEGQRVKELDPLYEPLTQLSMAELRAFGRPLDVTTNPTRPENLERLARLLDLEPAHEERLGQVLEAGIRHNVLNAKKHDEESRIIADAGALGAVTIATNMAGRGVDIKLGGEIAEEVLVVVSRVLRRAGVEDPETLSFEQRRDMLRTVDAEAIGIYDAEVALFLKFMDESVRVKEVGGLHVLGSERHEARRIDNQLRGRSGRQGDPGSSQFYLSLEDELMRLFGGGQVSSLMQRLNIDDAMPIAHNIVDRTIEQAQTRVEGANFDTRKHLLEYDDVLNQQREIYYGQRDRILTKEDPAEDLQQMLVTELEAHLAHLDEDEDGRWKLLAWLEEVQPTVNLDSGNGYPSFMLRLLVDSMSEIRDAERAREEMLQIAQHALESQHAHLAHMIKEQIERTLERMEEQVRQRVEMAEMAYEGVLLGAEESGQEIRLQELASAVENAAGLNISFDDDTSRLIAEDPHRFRNQIPELVEAGLGLRVWAGLVQAVERRLGDESLGLEPTLPLPIDWGEAEDQLMDALQATWQRRQELILAEIERELESLVGKQDSITSQELLGALVRMSYGQRTFFDRKTHQRKAMAYARLTYAFVAAELLDSREPAALEENILTHLEGAREAIELGIGRHEAVRLSSSRLDDMDQRWRENLQREMGEQVFEGLRAAGALAAAPEELQPAFHRALGRLLLTEAYRNLFLSLGDRRWVEYLTQMEALRTAIGLEAYGQRDPLVMYKSRAFDMFQEMLSDIRSALVSRMYRVQLASRPEAESPAAARPERGAAEKEKQPQASERSGKRKRRRRRR